MVLCCFVGLLSMACFVAPTVAARDMRDVRVLDDGDIMTTQHPNSHSVSTQDRALCFVRHAEAEHNRLKSEARVLCRNTAEGVCRE